VIAEEPVVFACEGEALVGVVSHARHAAATGVAIVVGGPQYRIGSHRQFVLLARALADAGIPALRFDYRGMGDATGLQRTFEDVDSDVAAAVETLCARAGVSRVVLWGLCDGASAALFHAARNPRVAGLVLINPWVRTEQGVARAYLGSYYRGRVTDPKLWGRVLRGEVDLRASAASLARNVRAALSRGGGDASRPPADEASLPLPERCARALQRFTGRTLVILSGDDITAREFVLAAQGDARWSDARRRAQVSWHELPGADHTFSTRAWRDEVVAATVAFVRDLDAAA
jgi:exosortase A-associated hydrolase 1